ncbi:hypothetical protein [Spirochaeta isovalerica]|uniref:Uncharacterized protein n=1 Tax=Spirochaeta isovalerica TaxID=150 RepID=A0A841RGD6_9SPIO|nr:hypothetical protein [Spirochaeta isovalerica]MBB6481588.1 hypothetical protein [Spirochaeta isovalerica]
MKEKIGEQYIRLDLLSFEQAEMVLNYQKDHKEMKFGDIAVYLGFLDKDQIGNSIKE